MARVSRAAGERERLRHALDRMRAFLDSLELAVDAELPIGTEQLQAIVLGAQDIATTIARHDAFELVETTR